MILDVPRYTPIIYYRKPAETSETETRNQRSPKSWFLAIPGLVTQNTQCKAYDSFEIEG